MRGAQLVAPIDAAEFLRNVTWDTDPSLWNTGKTQRGRLAMRTQRLDVGHAATDVEAVAGIQDPDLFIVVCWLCSHHKVWSRTANSTMKSGRLCCGG